MTNPNIHTITIPVERTPEGAKIEGGWLTTRYEWASVKDALADAVVKFIDSTPYVEPLPDEPTWLGAVVDREGVLYVRARGGRLPWVRPTDGNCFTWDELIEEAVSVKIVDTRKEDRS
jgi:hypothetical protein